MANMCGVMLKDAVTSAKECKCEYLLIMHLFTRPLQDSDGVVKRSNAKIVDFGCMTRSSND